jgi:hypothetical protein
MHRINGLVVCSRCEAALHPTEFGPPAYKETAEELAMREERRVAREEAPGRIIREMQAMMVRRARGRVTAPSRAGLGCRGRSRRPPGASPSASSRGSRTTACRVSRLRGEKVCCAGINKEHLEVAQGPRNAH